MLLLGLWLFSGCVSMSPAQKEAVLPPPTLDLQEMVVYGAGRRAADHRRTWVKSLVIHETDIRDVLKLLFQDSDLNLVIDPEVQGSVTLHYRDMPIEAIMESILTTNGYLYTIADNTIRIGKRGTRIFKMNLSTQGETSAWATIETELKKMATGDGQVILNPMAGTIMVTDEAEKLDRMKDYIRMVEEAMSRQVLTEAKVIEVVLSDSFQFGVDYSLFANTIGVSADGVLAGGATLAQTLAPKGGVLKFGVTKPNKFSTLLELLQTQGQVNVLSSPRIVTLNNTTATINIAEKIPVIERTIVDTESGSRTEFDISFQDAGITLDVTPKIGPDAEMIVTVKPKITEQTGTVTTPDGSQSQPILNVRESSNTIRVRDGESIVIGGFIQNRKSEEISKVPFLGDLPVINPLFRSTAQRMEKVELIIVLTPKILTSAVNRRMLDDSLGRIKNLTRPFGAGILQGEETKDFTGGFFGHDGASRFLDVIEIDAGRVTKGRPEKGRHVSRSGMAGHHLEKGRDAFEKGRLEQAAAAYEKSLSFDPLWGEAYWRLALVYETVGNQGKSRQMTERYLQEGEASAGPLNRLAMTYSKSGDQGLAAQLLETALRTDPQNPILHNNLGVVYKRMGRLKMAEQALRKSLRSFEDYPEALYNLALVLEARKLYKGAVLYYERFLARVPHSLNEPLARVRAHMEMLAVYLQEERVSGMPETPEILEKRVDRRLK